MKNYAFCPVSPKVVNENVARLNATFTTLLVILFLLTFNIILMAFLLTDFLIRSIDKAKYSPLAITSRGISKTLSLKTQKINAGPKLFAARIGMLFSVATVFLFFIGTSPTAFIVACVLGVFSFLEAAFGFCVACKVYPYMYRWLYVS
ncbi:DUF4395 domain-containing protein [Marinilabilia rubra]|uniref:DUF4395 domain-containing protein n=1 Tax=Marinilabilia rubra TaxID=2162893 RepID=A0A2U2B7X3_9BACT|nr:DUF4395 domain-containing protein [Marinilabilia rubra]PWD99146.1 DUF4395 domain-containing protein [Marinilabilia rubra]